MAKYEYGKILTDVSKYLWEALPNDKKKRALFFKSPGSKNLSPLSVPLKRALDDKLKLYAQKRDRVRGYADLVKPYAHKYPSFSIYLDNEKNISEDTSMLFYALFMACMHGWIQHTVSTGDTIEVIQKVIEYLKQTKDNEDKDKAAESKALLELIEIMLTKMELPFRQGVHYSRYFLPYPNFPNDLYPKKEGEEVHREVALFLMLFFQLHGSMRLRYARECERIRSSEFFRFMQYKSQVMHNSASDEQRTRITHSLEVAGIAKTVASQLGCNWELAEAMALGHDFGHVPFGHVGEEQLDACLHNAWAGRFAHSLQSVKVLNHLSRHSTIYDNFGISGLCLSQPVLEGVLKHDTDCLMQDISRASWRLQYDEWKEALLEGEETNITIGGLESQIVYWADKIAYAGHDWDEMVRWGMVSDVAEKVDDMLHRIHQVRHIARDPKKEKSETPKYLNKTKVASYTEDQIIDFIYARIEDMRFAITIPPVTVSEKAIHSAFSVEEKKEHPENQSPLKNLVDGLKMLFDNDNSVLKKTQKLQFFSNNSYARLYFYFSVAYHWILITGIYPKQFKKNDDVVWILNHYLCGIDNRAVVRAFETHLITKTRETLKAEYDGKTERDVRDAGSEAMTNPANTSIEDPIDGKNTLAAVREHVSEIGYISDQSTAELKEKADKVGDFKKWFKRTLQRKMIVSMDEKYVKALGRTSSFVGHYYIGSPRVRSMKLKGKMIIKALFEFYMAHQDMLPEEYQLRIGFDTQKLTRHPFKGSILEVPSESETEEEKSNRLLGSLVYKYLEERCAELKEQRLSDYSENLLRLKDGEEKWHQKFERLFGKTLPPEVQSMMPTVQSLYDPSATAEQQTPQTIDEKQFVNLCRHITTARTVADYIACMTDRMAEKKYTEITSASTAWSTSYHE
ncbi:MAG: HD domain-containing protein [Oscillospiraceae bacterium]|nr:HD domain-containing protein [Oscillospiraceae bacterium]